jgi:gamma-glutamylaminecyclotransferase
MTKLFTVGTLKRGFALNWALDGSQYLGEYRSIERFPLLVAGSYYAPMFLNQPGVGRRVIDPLESIGRPGNLRIALRVEAFLGGETCDAFAYAKAPALATPVISGYLNNYRDRRFIPSWQRHSV